MPAGQKLKFSNPLSESAASSPVMPAGVDPVQGELKPFTRAALTGNNYVMNIAKLDRGFTWFLRGFNIPGISSGLVEVATPFVDMNVPGDKAVFNPLILRMALAEDWSNYLQIHRWFRGLMAVDDHRQHQALLQETFLNTDSLIHLKETSDLSITMMTNSSAREMVTIHYEDAFPTAIEDIDDIGPGTDGEEITFTTTIFYKRYRIFKMPTTGFTSA